MNARRFRRLINWYPPYIGAAVRADHVSADFSRVEVSMALRWYNRNYVGTHFGGNLYTMVDPFYMIMMLERLGSEYIVWDKAATIEFLKPGRGRVRAVFELDDATIATVHRETAGGAKYEPVFPIEIIDEDGTVVARVRKTLYIRLKERARQANSVS